MALDLDSIKRKLHITWEDPETDARVQDVANIAKSYVERVTSLENVDSEDSPFYALYLNACLYEFSDALDDFPAAYADEIAQARQYAEGLNDAQEE